MNIAFLRFYAFPTPQFDRLAECLRARGYTAWVGTLGPDNRFEWHDGERVFAAQPGPAPAPDWLSRLPVLASVSKRITYLVFMLGIRKYLRAASPDIVQVNPTATYFSWLLPVFMPGHIRFILDFNELLQRSETTLIGKLRSKLDNWMWQTTARYFYDCTCFVNEAGARKVLGPGWPRLASVIPVGMGEGFLSCHPPSVAATHDDRPVQFVYLGVLSPVRQLEKLLAAIQTAQSMTDRFHVTFIGSDASEGFYQRMVEQLGLGQSVTIKPPLPYSEVPAAASVYDAALTYVPDVPADWLYYPTLKVQEYRALGLPIIATDFEPNRQFVQEGVNGLLVPNTEEAWAGAITAFATDRNLLRDCQTNARNMRQGRTWAEVASLWEQEVYNLIVAESVSPPATPHRVASN